MGIKSLTCLVFGLQLPNYGHSTLYRIKKYDPNFNFDLNELEGDFEDIKDLNYDDYGLIKYFENNVDEYFYGDIINLINEWLKNKFPKFTITEKLFYDDDEKTKYYLNYNIPPPVDLLHDENHYITFEQFNKFKDSIDLNEFNKIYNILTGKSDFVQPSLIALSSTY